MGPGQAAVLDSGRRTLPRIRYGFARRDGNSCRSQNPIIFTLVQERAPKEFRGRVRGALNSLAMVAMPLGILLAGYLLELTGLRPILISVAAAYMLVSLSMLFNPAFRDMEAPGKDEPEPRPASVNNDA